MFVCAWERVRNSEVPPNYYIHRNMENLAYGRNTVTEELARGREFVIQLRRVLNEGDGDNYGSSSSSPPPPPAAVTPFAEKLVQEVLMSFTDPLLFLNDPTSDENDVSDVQQPRETSMPEDSQESNCKSSISSIDIEERRGCCKRR